MSRLSLILARTIDRGRAERSAPTRAGLLEALLRKRATADNQGADDLEVMLREQIRWSLPMEHRVEEVSSRQRS